jgi:CRP-like cAMP-binding protein
MISDCKTCIFKSKAAETLGDAEFEHLSCNNAMVKFRKGNSIFTQGAFSTNVVYLRNGLAKIHITGPYHEQIVRIVKAPRYLGLPTTIGDKINQYSVTAISDVEVCFIDISTFGFYLKKLSILHSRLFLISAKMNWNLSVVVPTAHKNKPVEILLMLF